MKLKKKRKEEKKRKEKKRKEKKNLDREKKIGIGATEMEKIKIGRKKKNRQ